MFRTVLYGIDVANIMRNAHSLSQLMTDKATEGTAAAQTTFAPLQISVFRNMWIASLFSNFSLFVRGVGAA